MKRCPECRRDYYDETLLYCLDDGARLLLGPVSANFAATEVLPSFESRAESPTRLMSDASFTENHVSQNTIAVLPFLNLTPDKDGDYFSDGLSEELLNVLSKIRRLRVAARTSAFSFKGTQTTIAEIGRKLNVASVLEGSIRRASERVRISVQLVQVQDGFRLWSETYDRTMDDIFAVQDDIAQSVVEELRVRLLGEERTALLDKQVVAEVAEATKGRAADPEAQRLMLLGRHFLDRTTRVDTAKAIGYFRRALDLDPEYALCWAELGRAFLIEAGRAWVPVPEGYERVGNVIESALKLEPDLAEAYAVRERLQDTYEWDIAGAGESIRRALELAPGSSSVLDRAGILAYKTGRFDEAVGYCRQAVAQDPLSAAIWHNLGLTAHAAGRLDEAENAFREALELSPQRFLTGAMLSLVLLDGERFDEAAEQAGREPDEFWRLWALCIIDHRTGRGPDSDQRLDAILREHAAGSAFQIAEIYTARGQADEAFQWLHHAFDERDSGVTHTKASPRLRPLHDDPRWPGLLAKIGLQD